MSGFAGRLRERIAVATRDPARDALGAGGGWIALGECWAEIAPAGRGEISEADARAALPLWRVRLRARTLNVGDRMLWRGRDLRVREVRSDPALAGRLEAIAEEQR